MISASHRKLDSREALFRWLRDRSSGGRTSHSGTLDCRFPILDCMPFPRFSIESHQSKSPKILAGNILQCFSVAGARRGLNRIRLQLAIHFCLLEAVCRKTLQKVDRDPGRNSCPKIPQKTICRIKAVLSRIASLGDEQTPLLRFGFADCARTKGKSKVKRAAFSELRLDPYSSWMFFNHHLCNVESKSYTATILVM